MQARQTWPVAVGILFSIAVCSAAPPRYTLIDLGVTRSTNDGARDVNQHGQVALQSYARAYLWDNGVVSPPGGIPNGTTPLAMNDLGHLAGIDSCRAWIWRDDTVTYVTGALDCYDINDADKIVGGWSLNGGFVWDDGQFTYVGALDAECTSVCSAINNSDQVIGYSSGDATGRRAFLWENGSMTDLGSLSGYACSIAWDINDNGQVVGSAMDRYEHHAKGCLWDDGQIVALPDLHGFSNSFPFGINNKQQIVGNVTEGWMDGGHAVLWEGGSVYDLNSLLDDAPEWTVVDAQAINDDGAIAGMARKGSVLHAVLLVPEPATSSLLALGWLVLAGLKKRRRTSPQELRAPSGPK